MKKTIKIDGKDCIFEATAGTLRRYRMRFNSDMLVDMQKLTKGMNFSKGQAALTMEALSIYEQAAYIMHKQGDPSQPDDIDEWLDQFEMMDVYEVLPEIIDLWIQNTVQTSTSKK